MTEIVTVALALQKVGYLCITVIRPRFYSSITTSSGYSVGALVLRLLVHLPPWMNVRIPINVADGLLGRFFWFLPSQVS